MKKLLLAVFAAIIGLTSIGQTTIYSEDFEGASLPTGWGQTTSATDGGFQQFNSYCIGSRLNYKRSISIYGSY